MAELKKIERMVTYLEKYRWNATPHWIKGISIDGAENQHISGQLREMSDLMWEDESARTACILMAEAAEKLDDAHLYWLERQSEKLKEHLDTFVIGSTL